MAGISGHTGARNPVISRDLHRFLRFCVVGAAGFVVDATVLYAVAPILGWYGARVVSFLAAATVTWFLNKRYTFVDRDEELDGDVASHATSAIAATTATTAWRQYGQYLLSMVLGGCVNYIVYAATLHWIHVPFAALLGVALGSCAGLGVNFLTASRLVFRGTNQRIK